ncbi:phospholipid-transporting ATPase Dnf1p [Trichomonascus vanleenenianus]|uniref:phospholipid-transporting ATPase Dnf1p n=1 Tax=Trichomonascus vanleenenianus TaxID=2268995 RepID=UPI003ECAB66B
MAENNNQTLAPLGSGGDLPSRQNSAVTQSSSFYGAATTPQPTESATEETAGNHASSNDSDSHKQGEAVETTEPKKTKRLRWGVKRSKKTKGSKKQTFRKISQHVPILSSLVEAPDKVPLLERTLYINQPLPEQELDPETHLPKNRYPRNKVRTTKYTPLSFIPKDLYYQFHNIANIYFLFIAILSGFSIFGVTIPGLAAVPIIVIVVITAFKDAIEDYRRMVLDSEVNNTVTRVLTNFENANVVLDNVSAWRRFKKASTRGLSRLLRATVRGTRRLLRKPVSEKYGEKRPDLLQLQATNTRNSTIGSSMRRGSEYSSYYGGSGPGLPGSDINLATPAYGQRLTVDKNESRQTVQDPWEQDGSVVDPIRPIKGDAMFRRDFWKSVYCGDIVKVRENEEFPADLVVISSSDSDGACYIETRNLDGETNLKARQALKATSMIRRPEDLEQAKFHIESEAPHPGLYSYNGVLRWEQRQNRNDVNSPVIERTEPVSINNLLLRGCALRNTKWIIGVAVYTGADTKVMLNTGETPAKRSRIARELNVNVICNLVFVFILALIAAVINGVHWGKPKSSIKFFEFGSIGKTPALNGFITFWAAIILLQNLIPISLYISIEIIKTIHAFYIWSDIYMYYEPIDYPCTPKSWSISDDLGQVEYIFADKTGTLTQNVMEFRKCTINAVPYGKAFTEAMIGMLKRRGEDVNAISVQAQAEIDIDKKLMFEKLEALYDNPELDKSLCKFVSSEAVAGMAGEQGPDQAQAIKHFFLVLAICHSVLPERDRESKQLLYKAQSPDEEALVNTARDMGFTLLEQTRRGYVLDVQGARTEFEVLNIIEFSSARKRMSVICRMPDGRIMLFSKGADNVIYSRLSGQTPKKVREQTAQDLEDFANEGLRTLCIAERELTEEEYREWSKKYDIAASSLTDREDKMEEVAEEIEQQLVLIGGTAIEDRLQDGVPNAVAVLGQAGIKTWVLTGDKVETAINIGYSCNLLGNDMELLVLQLKEGTKEEADGLLTKYLSEYFQLTGSDEEIKEAKKSHAPPTSNFAVVVDGDALEMILHEDLVKKFVLLCKQCKSVLCCRTSPAQKGAVVRAVKNTLDVMTLAIGDGANDVTMITEADVGVGIAGLEGRQAVMSSDYAFGQFRFITRLLLVHGRWAYRRVAELTANLFYKNVVFTLTLFWYDVHNNFDGSYLFDYTYITLFNLAFTSLPVIFLGFLDQDVNDKVSMAVPELYQRGILRKEWTQTKFWIYMVDGVYQSVICYFFSYLVFFTGGFVNMNGLQINNRESYGVFTATSAIIACNLYVAINDYSWDWLFCLIVAISILLVFFWTGIYTQFQSSQFFYKAASQVYSSIPFWACIFLAVIVCLLPRFAAKAYQKMFMPYDVDIIRERFKMGQYDHLRREDEEEQIEAEKKQAAVDEARRNVFEQYDEESQTGGGAEPLQPPPRFSSDEPRKSHESRRSWRQSFDEAMGGERMRMSMDINELTKAKTLLSQTSSTYD